jgi:DNA-binding NarL/FixJ family response regulator
MAHKILVVDDNPVIRSLIRLCIEQRTNWQVCGEAANGEVAVGEVAELNPDAVILDLQMPVMNGLDAAREIGRKASNIPMLMLTTHYSEQLLRAAEAVGIKDVCSKIDGLPDHLIAAIQKLLGVKNLGIPQTRIINATR